MRHLLVLNISRCLILKKHHQIVEAIHGIADRLPDPAQILILLHLLPAEFFKRASEALVVR